MGNKAEWLLQFVNKPLEMCLERKAEITVEGIIPGIPDRATVQGPMSHTSASLSSLASTMGVEYHPSPV